MYSSSVSPIRSAQADARNRAWRTFVHGLLLDVTTAVVVILLTELHEIRWTRAYWVAIGGLVAKTVIQSVVSYVARRLAPPSV